MLAPRQSRPILPLAIQRYFDVALYLLVLTGVGTLASTGTLGLPTVLFVGGALVFRGYLLAERRTLIIPERWTSFLTIAYAAFYLADYFLMSRAFLGSTVHLVLFVMVVRLFSTQRDRDHYFLVIISFLMVLAAAVLTVDSVFVVTFTAFIFMAIVTCILLEMKQAAATAAFQSANAGYQAHRRMAFSIVKLVPGLVLLTALGGAAIFFILPRRSASYLGSFSGATDLSTGFSEKVELGGIGRIEQSNALVMHIAIDGDTTGAHDLKWRGISLNNFDGRNWSDSHAKAILPVLAGDKFELKRSKDISIGSTTLHYHVLMEPMGSTIFFLAPTPWTLQGTYGLVSQDDGGAVFDDDVEHPVNRYEATSSVGTPSNLELRAAQGAYPDDVISDYIRTPALDARIPELAQSITAQQLNNYDRAVAIENYLRSHFGYTLQLSRTRPRDPLADFLFVRKRGHCEYFASSMAIMLRTLGIPSRVVNGFRTGEFNDLTSQYLVRESDAHSWVEAYFQNYGWVTFDPTPAGAIELRSGWDRAALYLDAMASFWREWVISYDSGHQASLGRLATQDSLQWFHTVRQWTQRKYGSMLSLATRTRTQVDNRPVRWGAAALAPIIGFLLFAGTARWSTLFRHFNLLNSAKLPRTAASIWYDRMLRRVARKGWRKLPSQTPAEFLISIDDEMMKRQVAKFTATYENARFGGSEEDARCLPELYKEISHVGEK